MNRLRVLHLCKQLQIYRTNHFIQPFYLSKLSFFKNSIPILNHNNNIISKPQLSTSYSLFSTISKDENTSNDPQTTDPATASDNTEQPSQPSSEDPPTTKSDDNQPPTPNKHVPLIRIHDEQKPQLSIQLPNRWPFKRLARPPKEEPLPLNMHEMTTFSGLPAQNFMPTEADKQKSAALLAEEQKKSKEEKKREERAKFWKRYSIVVALTPIILYILDNRKAKKLAKRRAQYISASRGDDARLLRDMAKLNNSQLMDFYHWVIKEECDGDHDSAMTIDRFGELFVNAVNIFKQRSGINDDDGAKAIRLSREYDDELTVRQKKNELKWLSRKYEMVKDKRLASKTKEIQPWDLNIFFTEYNVSLSNKISLNTLFTGISQITTDPLYIKSEIGFRIKGQHLTAEEPRLRYNDLIELIDDMIITGHFSTDSLIVRKSYFPSQFGIRTSKEIVDIIYDIAGIDRLNDDNEQIWISFKEFGNALEKLAESKKWYETMVVFLLPINYKPWIQVWYCSDRSKNEIKQAENEEKRRLRKIEEKKKKQMKKMEKLVEGTNDDLTVDSPINSDSVTKGASGNVQVYKIDIDK